MWNDNQVGSNRDEDCIIDSGVANTSKTQAKRKLAALDRCRIQAVRDNPLRPENIQTGALGARA